MVRGFLAVAALIHVDHFLNLLFDKIHNAHELLKVRVIVVILDSRKPNWFSKYFLNSNAHHFLKPAKMNFDILISLMSEFFGLFTIRVKYLMLGSQRGT